MNLYTVVYKNYGSDTQLGIVASSVDRACDTAQKEIRKRHYGATREILSCTKVTAIDRVQK